MRAIKKYCNSATDCPLKTLKCKISQGLEQDIVQIGSTQKTLKTSTNAVEKKLSELTDAEFDIEIEKFIENIEQKSLKDIRKYENEYFKRKIDPSYKNIRQKEKHMDDIGWDWELKKEIDALNEKHKELVAKGKIIRDIQAKKEYNLFWTLSENQKYIDVQKIHHAKSYLDNEELSILAEYFDMYPNNVALRTGKLSNKGKKEIEIMDRAFKKAPELEEDAVVYRALSNYDGDDINYKWIKDFMNSIQEGAIIKDKAYMSTAIESTSSIFRQFAWNAIYSDGVLMRIKLPKGTKALIQTDECVLPRNSELKINKVQFIDGVKIVDAEYILPQ